jgi:ketosteroid isomerase-like protein
MNSMTRAKVASTISIILIATAALSFAKPPQQQGAASVEAVVEKFHSALASGDANAAMELLARDAIILESGSAETREQYQQHHLADDIAFSRAVQNKRSTLTVEIEGDVAWVVSTSRSKGSFHEREINSVGTELVVLTKSAEGWRIRAIHWSSHDTKKNN